MAFLNSLDGDDSLHATRIKNDPENAGFDRSLASELDCSCTRVDGSGGQTSLEAEYAYTYFYVLAILLALAAVATVVFSGLLKEKFGTLGYFLAFANAKVTNLYRGLLGCSTAVMVISLLHLLVRVERERKAANLTQDQYDGMYEVSATLSVPLRMRRKQRLRVGLIAATPGRARP